MRDEWPHPISETIQGVLYAGLGLRFIAEGRTLDWQVPPELIPAEQWNGFVLPPPGDERIPLTYT
ncbi:MAG: methyltransferase type 12, partial [Ornithinimicrobium sp.]